MTNDDRIRERILEALGEPPDADPAVWRLEAHLASLPDTMERPRPPARMMALVAGVLAVAVIVTLTGTRLLASHGRPEGVPANGGVCRLPVVVTRAGYPPTTITAGFVEIQGDRTVLDGGTVKADPSAGPGAMTYDPVLRRWLPVRPTAVSPDQRSYAYVRSLGQSFELHVVDGRTRADRVVWAGSGGIDFPVEWEADGIHVTVGPAGGGLTEEWVVDPSGRGHRPGSSPRITAEFGRTNIGTFAPSMPYEAVFHGMAIVRDATFAVYLAGPGDQRTVIHYLLGGFDPSTFVADGDRLWAVNADGTEIWLWTRNGGLQAFPLNAAPQPGVTYWVAGPCT
jgi:hypothetical protein